MRTVRLAVFAIALLALFALSAATGDIVRAEAPGAQPQGAAPSVRYDWNNDNCSDIFDTGPNGAVRIYKGDCSGQIYSYIDPTPLGLVDADQYLLPGDWDGDGCKDILVFFGSSLSLITGDCGTGVVEDHPLGDFSGYDFFIAPGLWSSDANPDLLARRTTDGALVLWTGDGDFGLATGPFVVGTGWDVFNWISGIGDFDNDSCLDLAGRRKDDGTLRFYPGDCGSGFKAGQNSVIGQTIDWRQYDWLLAGGNWGFDIGNGCPDIAGWSFSEPNQIAFHHGNCTGDLTGVAVVANQSAGWGVPFAGDGTGVQSWGDDDCTRAVAPRDAQAGLKFFLAQAPLSQNQHCPSLGAPVKVNGITHIFGDWDCSGAIAPRDSQAVLTYFLEFPALSQTEPCPDIGKGVVYDENT